MRARTRISLAAAVVAAVLLAAVVGFLGPCGRRLGHVRYVLPDGFRGLVVVIEDAAAPEVPFVGDRHVVHVPKDGVVRVRSATPLLEWHVVDPDTWVFEDGTPVPAAEVSEAALLPPDDVRVFGGGSFSRGGSQSIAFDVVATARDAPKLSAAVGETFDRLFPRR